MSSELLTVRLDNVHAALDKGQPEIALDLLREILQTAQTVEVYRLRLDVLVALIQKGIFDVNALHETLQWLKEHHPALYGQEAILAPFAKMIRHHVDKLSLQIETENVEMSAETINTIDSTLQLADHFPEVAYLRVIFEGQLFLLAQRAKELAGKFATLRRTLDIHQINSKNKNRKRNFETRTEVADLLHNSEQVLALLPSGDPYRAFLFRLMGLLCEAKEEWIRRAYEAYQEAAACGLDVEENLKRLLPKAWHTYSKDTLFQIDTLIQAGKAAEAANIAEALYALAPRPEGLLVWGDALFGLGNYAAAEKKYTKAYPYTAKASNTKHLQEMIALHQKATLLAAAIKQEGEKADKAGDPHPLARLTFGTKDLQHQALTGLYRTYQAQGKVAEAQTTLSALLNDPKLPEEVSPRIVPVVERLEQEASRSEVEAQRATALAHAEAKAWHAASEGFYRLTTQPLAEEHDFAWLVIAQFHSGMKIEGIAHLMGKITPQTLKKFPGKLTRPLIDALAAAERWLVADAYAAAIPDGRGWRAAYATRRAAYIDSLITTASQALDQHNTMEAETLARRALELAPDHVQGRLIIGRVYAGTNRLADGRRILGSILADPLWGGAASMALAEIDLATGKVQDARERLATVPEAAAGVDVAAIHALRVAIVNRLQEAPYIHLEPFATRVSPDTLRRKAATGYAAYFAVKIVNVRAARTILPIRDRCAELLTAVSVFNGGAGAGVELDLAWRYIGGGGRLTIALLCRVDAPNEKTALHTAQTLWTVIKPILPLQGLAYTYEPVYGAAELAYLRQPFPIESAAEITRKEITIRGNKADDELYLVYPLNSHDDPLTRMLYALSEQPEPTLLNIHIKPTEVFQWEREIITQTIRTQGTPALETLPDVIETGAEAKENTPDFRAGLIRQFYPFFLDRTQAIAFVVQLQLASQGALDAALPNIVSMGLFGFARYEITPALHEGNLDAVRRNLGTIEAEQWVYSAAPGGLERWRGLFTPDETLTASRLPHPGAGGLPGMPVLKIRTVHPPDLLPREGVVIGESLATEGGRPMTVRLTEQDRTRHAYVVGRTGSGKSTLLLNMALQDIEAGRGVGVIDPHGDLIRLILERIPAHRLHDVMIFDPADTERPVALNILDVEDMFEGNMVIADFLGLMRRMFDPHDQGIVGPRFENIIRNAMLALLEAVSGTTLIDVVRFLSDKDFREHTIKNVTDPVVLNYWNNIGKELDRFGWGSAKGEVIDWLTSKFGRFVDDKMMRNIIGQSQNTLNFRQIMDEGKILLVDLSKGRMGYQSSQFLGLLLVPRLLVAALTRARQDMSVRRPFYLYVDEFQSFVTPAFSEMLSEARKFKVSLTVANQFISQLMNEIREAVFGNVGNFFVFQVGIKDGAFLAPEMYPAELEDLVNLPNFHMLAKMLIEGNATPPFPVRTLPDSRAPNPELAAKIREYSRQRYGRDAFIVTQEIQQRFAKVSTEEGKSKGLFDKLVND